MADSSRSTRTRQQYARLLADNDNDGAYDPGCIDSGSEVSIQMTSPRKRVKVASVEKRVGYLPTARRFWADFTLGFADGLTVPFALTAGLSSLGRTDTVVYAGLAEVSAGCISMGIGGYLSARQAASTSDSASAEDTQEAVHDIESPEMEEVKTSPTDAAGVTATAHRYLAPLALPAELHQQILAYVTSEPHAAEGLLEATERKHARDDDYGYGYYEPPAKEADDDSVWPVAAGVSVALGYLIGGLLPLWPYFFVTHVGDGLRYSFAVCIVALFLFGFIRDFALDSPVSSQTNVGGRRRIPWRRLWKSTFEGLQMVILGGIAAIAAVLCVRLFEGANTSASS
ncbi:hypothetical protein Sste5346_008327 [Sporothrix stenoceras]|uniref:Vacuolar iron transporter n=1 Tax=Sporothrix stenoceras TaxID=5173 RepID=A0ABR3YR51_9PEZI